MAQVLKHGFSGSSGVPSICVQTICSQFDGSHLEQNSFMKLSNFSLASNSQSVNAQSATGVFLKHPSIFMTLLSSMTKSFVLMKKVLQCISKLHTTLGMISLSSNMGAWDRLG